MSIPVIHLRPKRDRRLRSGHPWVFSNEIADDVAALPRGGTVDVVDARGAFLGRGYANPQSLIAIRLLSRSRVDIDHPAFWADRLRSAAAYRDQIHPGRTSMRVVNAEGDGLPGMVIDRYGDYLAIQLTTLGMETRRALLRQAIEDVLAPRGAVLRSAGPARQREGLDDEHAVWFGDAPEHVDIDEFGVLFRVPLLGGQKTGHFYDQAENRRFAGGLCRDRSVLDVYANTGGWALHALANGARYAITVEKSAPVCELIAQNAALNDVADAMEVWCGEGRALLMELVSQSRQFGAVVLDPPAFAKTRKSAGSALRGYREINALALQLVQHGGFLFTSSCSYHVDEDRFVEVVHQAARRTGRRLRIVRRGEQGADHPVLTGVPETRYLKSYALQVEMER